MKNNQPTRDPESPAHAYHAWTGKLASRGMEIKARSGHYPSAAPLGYLNTFDGLVPDPVLGPLIAEAFEHDAQGISVRKSLAVLTAKGLRSHRGNVLTASALWRILRNPIYEGWYIWNGKRYVASHTPLKRA